MREGLDYIECCFNGGTWPDAQNIATDPSYAGAELSETVGGAEVVAYPSAGYDESKSNSVVYLLHDGLAKEDLHRMMNLWNVAVNTKPFIVVCVPSSQAGSDFATLAQAIDAKYAIAEDADRHFGAGLGSGAGLLYRYAAGEEARLAALYLFDGEVDVEATAPCSGTYYYIDTTDGGEHYVEAGELYERCKADGVPYDYRVRNGQSGADAAMGGFQASKSNLMDRIRN